MNVAELKAGGKWGYCWKAVRPLWQWMKGSYAQAEGIDFGEGLQPILNNLYPIPKQPHRKFSDAFQVRDAEGNSFNGFIEQRYIMDGKELKAISLILYAVDARAEDSLTVRSADDSLLEFEFDLTEKPKFKVKESDGSWFMTVNAYQLDRDRADKRYYAIMMNNKQMAGHLAEDLGQKPLPQGDSLQSNKDKRFLFRADHKLPGIHPVVDLSIFKQVLADYMQLGSREEQDQYLDSLRKSGKNNVALSLTSSEGQAVEPIHWVGHYPDGYVYAERGQRLPDVNPRKVSSKQGKGVMWEFVSQ